MKSKLSWIPFVPLTLVALFCKLAPHFFPDGVVFGFSGIVLDYVFIGAVVLIFLFAVLFCALDDKISPYYQSSGAFTGSRLINGVVSLLLALCLAAGGAMRLVSLYGSGKIEILAIVEAILMILSAVVFITFGLNNLFRRGESKPATLFCVIPTLMFAVRMISCFVSFTTISLRLADVTALCCYVFATLFFFNYAVVLSLIESKRGVKKCFIYGLPAIGAMLAYGAERLAFGFEPSNVLGSVLLPLEMLLTSLYIFSYLVELTRYVKDRDTLIVIGADDDDRSDETVAERTDENADGFIVGASKEDNSPYDPDSSYLTTADTSDFLYREVKREEKPEGDRVLPDTDDYLTTVVDEDKDDDRPKDYESRLDEIDKLILEISEKK